MVFFAETGENGLVGERARHHDGCGVCATLAAGSPAAGPLEEQFLCCRTKVAISRGQAGICAALDKLGSLENWVRFFAAEGAIFLVISFIV